MRWLVLFAMGFMFLGARAQAQATRPAAPEAWAKAVDDLARSLSEGDAVTLAAVLDAQTPIKAFDGKASDALHLLGRMHKGVFIGALSYVGCPDTMASDLGERCREAAIPDAVKKRTALEDGQDVRRANTIAAEWIAQSLAPREDDLVGVAVFWCGDDNGEGTLVFVLVKGEVAAAGASVKSLTYGDPLWRARQ